jgi:hypothetical protein
MLKFMGVFKKKTGHYFPVLGIWYRLKVKNKIFCIKIFENPVSGCRLIT